MIDLGKKNILGIKINAVDYESATAKIMDCAERRKSMSVGALAVHGLTTGYINPDYARRLNTLDLITPDGQPVRWALNLIHHAGLKDRVYGPELTVRLLNKLGHAGFPLYLYGSTQQVLDRLVRNIKCKYPGTVIAGAEPSLFRPLTEMESKELIERINSSGARICFVGLGCPRQEFFVSEFCHHVNMPMLAVGAAFDFIAETSRQAPPWMQKRGLEWLFRLIQEPRRLWKRYLWLNPLYIWLIFLQWSGLRSFSLNEKQTAAETDSAVKCHTGTSSSKIEAKDSMPVVVLMNVRINAFTLSSLHEVIADIIRKREKAIVANVNVNAMNIAWEQPWFNGFLRQSEYVFCDGHGVMLAARLAGQDIPQKITYAGWFPQFCEFCADNGFSLYFLGGAEGVAEQARKNLEQMYPALKVVGCRNGYFNKDKNSAENRAVVSEINQASPDVLLTSFGMPLQERWLQENWQDLCARIALPGGGCLDYMAGKLKRPPPWMTEHGLEWLGRLCYEPRRLWKRYLIGNPLFFIRLLIHPWKNLGKKQCSLDEARR